VAPTERPVSLGEAKAHLRVDSSDDDALIQGLIDAAVSKFDGYSGELGFALLQQTWEQSFCGFTSAIRLPLGRVIGIASVTYWDSANVLQTLPTSVYTHHQDAEGCYVALKPGEIWPPTYGRDDAVTVSWTAGFGDAADTVPAAIRQAMLLLIGHWYANREAVSAGTYAELPLAVMSLIAPFRQVGV